MPMTTTYRKHDDQPKAGEVKPVVVRSQSAEQPKKPRKCVSVIVERTGLFWWFIRGISMGGGFALVWYGLQAVI